MKLKKTLALFLTAIICIMAFPFSASAAEYVKYKTANELVADLTAGWNLAGSLESLNENKVENFGWDGHETGYGNPRVTKEVFDEVRKAGFNFVRIPISWTDHIDADGNIDKEWLDRVQEVVDYAYDEGMFVIINSHGPNFVTLYDNPAKSIKVYKNMWKQIAERFKDYNQRLIFEGMNEPDAGDPEAEEGTPEAYEKINNLYKGFIETIRSSGGYNKNRLLMLAPFWAKSDDPGRFALEIPDDDKMIAVSIHEYVPWDLSDGDFDFNIPVTKFTDDGKKIIDAVFERIDEAFLSKGIPVIMGEYGFWDKSNTSERVKATKYYLSVAKKYGVPCAWWDGGITRTKIKDKRIAHGLLHRQTYEWYFPDIVNAIIDTAPESPFTSEGKLKAPTGFKAATTQTKIVLKWNEVKNADAYRVYMYNEKTGKYEKYKTVLTGICTITDLKKDTQYKFVVTPLVQNSNGEYVPQTNSKSMGITTKK